jgi:hypothetical protein
MPDFYVVRKYNHGWVIRDPKTDHVSFYTNEELAQKGYISRELKIVLPPASAPKVIIAPTEPLKRTTKAELNPDWRSRDILLGSRFSNREPQSPPNGDTPGSRPSSRESPPCGVPPGSRSEDSFSRSVPTPSVLLSSFPGPSSLPK